MKLKCVGCVQVNDVVFDHCIMVSARHKDRMATGARGAAAGAEGAAGVGPERAAAAAAGEGGATGTAEGAARGGAAGAGGRGIAPWHFEQNQDEAVFIPAGCPHQVRWVGKGLCGCEGVKVWGL